jgi:hypothetical protein
MMHQERRFNLSTIQQPPMQVLELQYHGGISMYIMLPEDGLCEVSHSCPTMDYCVQNTLGYVYFPCVCVCVCVCVCACARVSAFMCTCVLHSKGIDTIEG